MKDKMTKQVLISKRLGEPLHIASIRSGKSMREFLDDLIERALREEDILIEEEAAPSSKIAAPPDEIGSVSLRVPVVEGLRPEDISGRTF